MEDLAVDGIGDGAGLFADDDAYGVELLGDAYGRTMAETEVGVNVGVGGYGKNAACGKYGVAADDDRAVVERGILEKQRFEERGRGSGVDGVACGDEVVEFVLAFEDDESASL